VKNRKPSIAGRLREAVFFGLLLVVSTAFAIDTTRFEDPEKQAQYQRMTHEIRCVQCLNTSIADSQVSLAGDLRNEVRDLVQSGKSDEEIRQFMVDRYGEFVLFRPRSLWLWIAPIVFLAIGIIVAVMIIRQRAKLVTSDESPVDDDLSDDDKAVRR
jgi:cytochrome c-type biogenesis protein CcmH